MSHRGPFDPVDLRKEDDDSPVAQLKEQTERIEQIIKRIDSDVQQAISDGQFEAAARLRDTRDRLSALLRPLVLREKPPKPGLLLARMQGYKWAWYSYSDFTDKWYMVTTVRPCPLEFKTEDIVEVDELRSSASALVAYAQL